MSDQPTNDGVVHHAAQERSAKRKITRTEESVPNLDWLRDDDPYTHQGESTDGQLFYSLWIEPGYDTPVVSISGQLQSAEAAKTALEVIERVFAAAGPTGTPTLILRGLEAYQPEHLVMVADLIRQRNEAQHAAVELGLDVGHVAGELFRLLGLPTRGARIRWNAPEEFLHVRLPGNLK